MGLLRNTGHIEHRQTDVALYALAQRIECVATRAGCFRFCCICCSVSYAVAVLAVSLAAAGAARVHSRS